MKGEVPKCSFSPKTSLLLYDLYSLFSFIRCHPLYFAYFIFFFPYLFKLLSFLSPLLFSTSLFLVALLTISPHASHLFMDNPKSNCGFFSIALQAALDALLLKMEGDLKPDNLGEPPASFIRMLESFMEPVEQNHKVGRSHMDVAAAANQTLGSGRSRRSFREEWKIWASDLLCPYKDATEAVEYSEEKQCAELQSHQKTGLSSGGTTGTIFQLPTLKVRDSAAEDYPKSRSKVSQEIDDDMTEKGSLQVMTLTTESPGFDLEVSSHMSRGLIQRVGGDFVDVVPENDLEAGKSHKETTIFSCDCFGLDLKTTTLELAEAGENYSTVVLENDPEAYESPYTTSSSSESYGFDLETESLVAHSLTYKMGESPGQGGNDIGNLGCKIENASIVSQGLHEIPSIAALNVGRFRSGLKTAGTAASRSYVYKVRERCFEDLNGSEKGSRGPSSPDSMWSSPGGFESMKKDKEWKRTLACKLYEERMTADSVDGMDSLWEAYESDSDKMNATAKEKRGSKEKYKDKKSTTEYSREDVEEEDDDEDYDEAMDEKLCCLQALRFPTGKMNLGMRRPSLVKISKAFKGMGMLVREKGRSFR